MILSIVCCVCSRIGGGCVGRALIRKQLLCAGVPGGRKPCPCKLTVWLVATRDGFMVHVKIPVTGHSHAIPTETIAIEAASSGTVPSEPERATPDSHSEESIDGYVGGVVSSISLD